MAKRKRNEGFCWHVHHSILLEYCYDYEGRVRFIKECKPDNEVSTRLRLMKFMRGRLPKEVMEAFKEHQDAREAAEYKGFGDELWTVEIRAADKVITILHKNRDIINALHEKECPNCPWNGRKIVFSQSIRQASNKVT